MGVYAPSRLLVGIGVSIGVIALLWFGAGGAETPRRGAPTGGSSAGGAETPRRDAPAGGSGADSAAAAGTAPSPSIGSAAIAPGTFAGANLLLITVDTLRADALGAYGGPDGLTPNIDRLAGESVRFDAAFAHAAMTLPSHASILTGQFPFRHGVRANGSFRLTDSSATLAEALQAAAYRTGAFVGAFVLDVRFGLGQGFEHYDDLYGEQGRDDFRFVERRAEQVLQPAAAWIADQRQPWFAWVHLFDPHAPYAAPDEFMRGRRAQPYLGEVAYVDHAIGEFLDQLGAIGALDDALIVFTADHGESLGEHGEQTHGLFAYDATLRVPLLIRGGGRLPAAVRADPVGHVDIVPTVLELLGVDVPDAVQGIALLSSAMPPRRALYFEALDGYFTQRLAPLTGIVEGTHKYIDLPVRELYDLAADPGERDNLTAAERELTSEYRVALERVLGVGDVPAGASPALAGLIDTPAGGVDSVTRTRLAALGYLAGSTGATPPTFTAADDPKNALAAIEQQRNAAALFAEGRRAAAIASLRELLHERPAFIGAHLQLAGMLEATGNVPEALALLEAAHARAPADAAVAAKLGLMLALSGDAARATRLLQDALDAAPDHVELLENLAITHAAAARPAEARPLLQRVLEIDPSSASAHHNLGLTRAQQGDFAAAIEHFEAAIRLAPEFWHPYEGLAGVLASTGRMEEAVEAWKKQLDLNPAGTDAAYNLGIVLADLGRRAEALVYLDRFVAQAPAGDAGIPRARRLAADIRAALR